MKKIAFILILWCGLTGVSHAQSKQWTLEECIRYAVEHNISIQQMDLQRKNAERALSTSRNSRLPNLNAGIDQNWNFGRSPLETGLYKNQNQSRTSLSVSSSTPLFTGFRINNEIARDRLDLVTATENLIKAREDLSINITSLYLQVLFKQEILKINEQQLQLSKQQKERTQYLTQAGKVPQSQLYDIEAQVAKDEVSRVEAQNDLALALLDLAQSLELQNTTDFDVAIPMEKNVITQYSGSLQAPQTIFNRAVRIKPAIRANEYAVQSAEKSLKIAEAGYSPTLNLNLGYGSNYFYQYGLLDGVSNAALSNQLKNNANEYIGLSLNIPIFSRFAVRNQVRSAKINIDNRQLELEKSKQTLFKEIQTAYLNATSAKEKYHAAEKAVQASEESFRYAQMRYEVGNSSIFEFNEAKTKWVQVQSEMTQAKYDFILRTKILDFYNGK
ncbi:transporter [Bacteroidia bacterium]|nr:transporter [Bacteroidia bacterium]